MTEAEGSIDQQIKKASKPVEEALRLHPFYRGKIQMMPKCPVSRPEDLAIWYTPGVAAPCREIVRDPALVYEHTNRGNTIAIVSDGSRVLGLGDIGPAAGLPVMEGKALLFKYFGGVDAIPLCIDVDAPEEIIRFVRAVQPCLGGVNLEDISNPKCFRVLDELRRELEIPVWHDDQQGTSTVTLAGLITSLKVVGKELKNVRIAMIGTGAANVAVYRLLKTYGVDPSAIVACDSKGTLHKGRDDVAAEQEEYFDKWRICLESNSEGVAGGIAEAMRGADVCIAYSCPGPGVIQPEWVSEMADRAVVFAGANPVPEIWPWEAKAAGAEVVATGRSDFANQVNNSLCFPGIFRGVLDVRAQTISDGMAIAAAHALADSAEQVGLKADRILPSMQHWKMAAEIAAATGIEAQKEGLARVGATKEQLQKRALEAITRAREGLAALMGAAVIAERPQDAVA